MLTTKVYASQVNNLSDARYFAAWGVEYLGFNIDGELSLDQIKEIVDWVEGPTFVAETNSIALAESQIDLLASGPFTKLMVRPFFEGITLPGIDLIYHIEDDTLLGSYDEVILSQEEIETKLISKIDHHSIMWLDTNLDGWKGADLINLPLNTGILVRGGNEERPGVRNFDDLDDFFEKLSE